jgi:hypothetical protein
MKTSKEFESPEALRTYLREHPKADPRKHHVKRDKTEGPSGGTNVKVRVDKGVSDSIGEVWKNRPAGNPVDLLKKRVEEGKSVSLGLLGKAQRALQQAEFSAKDSEKRGLQSLRKQLKKYRSMVSHLEAFKVASAKRDLVNQVLLKMG